MGEALPPESDGDDRQMRKIVLIQEQSRLSVFHDTSQWLHTEINEEKVTKSAHPGIWPPPRIMGFEVGFCISRNFERNQEWHRALLTTSMKKVRIREGVSASARQKDGRGKM